MAIFAIFSTLESNFSKGCTPMAVNIYFSKLFDLRPLWAQNISKISTLVTLQKVQISIHHVLIVT